MEIKVGEYIRSSIGIIGKFHHQEGVFLYDDSGHFIDFASETIKHSKNITDLIEVGDIVNQNERILDITGDYILTTERNCCKSRFEKTIKTILTHEMYEKNCYKVGVD